MKRKKAVRSDVLVQVYDITKYDIKFFTSNYPFFIEGYLIAEISEFVASLFTIHIARLNLPRSLKQLPTSLTEISDLFKGCPNNSDSDLL